MTPYSMVKQVQNTCNVLAGWKELFIESLSRAPGGGGHYIFPFSYTYLWVYHPILQGSIILKSTK